MESKRIESSDGKYYYNCKGYFHREDGPAIILYNGQEIWYVDSIVYHTSLNMPINIFLAYCKWEYKKHGK